MQLKSVVLPAPFGPIKPQIAPRATSKRDVLERGHAAEPDGQPLNRQQSGGPEVRIMIRASSSRLGQLHGLPVPAIVRLVKAGRHSQS